MTRILMLLVLTASLPAFTGMSCDSWAPFLDHRVVSPSGMRYAVIRRLGQKASFELVQRRANAGPMTAAVASRHTFKKSKPVSIDRDPEDTLIAKGTLPQLPYESRVLEDGGLVAIDQYARLGYGDVLTWVDPAGKIRTRLQLKQIFDKASLRSFSRSVSSIHWAKGWCVCNSKSCVFVVAAGGLLRRIDLASGEVTTPDASELWSVVERAATKDREFALDFCTQHSAKGLSERSLALARDSGETISVRLRAALAASTANAPESFSDLFRSTLIDESIDASTRRFAAINLPKIMGSDALTVLRNVLRGNASKISVSIQEGLASMGTEALPTLVAMVAEVDESPYYRGTAAHVLRRLKSQTAVDVLAKAVADESKYLANAACSALIATAPDNLGELLASHLVEGTTQDRIISYWFGKNKHPKSLAALKEAATRYGAGTSIRRVIDRAIIFQSSITK